MLPKDVKFLPTEGLEVAMCFVEAWGLEAGLLGGLEVALAVLPGSLDAQLCGDGHVEMVPRRTCSGSRDFENHRFCMLNVSY